MEKKLARELLPLVNDPHDYALLVSYVEDRARVLKEELATTESIEDIRKKQGALLELRRILQLRDTILSKLKDE